MQSILRFVQLAPPERALFFRAYCLLTVIRLGLWVKSFNHLRKVLAQTSTFRQTVAEDPLSQRQFIVRIHWAINAACKFMPGSVKCLARALAMKTFLDWANCPAKLVIGVDKNSAAQLEAHAWVEYEGQVIMGQLDDLNRFKPLPNLPQFLERGDRSVRLLS